MELLLPHKLRSDVLRASYYTVAACITKAKGLKLWELFVTANSTVHGESHLCPNLPFVDCDSLLAEKLLFTVSAHIP